MHISAFHAHYSTNWLGYGTTVCHTVCSHRIASTSVHERNVVVILCPPFSVFPNRLHSSLLVCYPFWSRAPYTHTQSFNAHTHTYTHSSFIIHLYSDFTNTRTANKTLATALARDKKTPVPLLCSSRFSSGRAMTKL